MKPKRINSGKLLRNNIFSISYEISYWTELLDEFSNKINIFHVKSKLKK